MRACAAAALLAMQVTLVSLTCRPVYGLQVLQLDECTSLQEQPAAAAILAIARHGKLDELALPYLRGLQGAMVDVLRNSKYLRRLSLSSLWYVSPFHRGPLLQFHCSRHWPVARLQPQFYLLLQCYTFARLAHCLYVYTKTA